MYVERAYRGASGEDFASLEVSSPRRGQRGVLGLVIKTCLDSRASSAVGRGHGSD